MAKRARGATRLYQEQAADGINVIAVALKLLLLALVLGGGAWGTQLLLDPQQFPLRTVRIESQLKHVAQATIRETVRPHVADGFIGVDVDAVRDSLKKLPWVDTAEVRRAWPDKLVIRVREQKVMARWGQDALLNVRGELFQPPREELWRRLPLLRGPRGTNSAVAEQYVAMQGMLKPLGLAITHMTLNERRALSVRLDNGLKLGLGRENADLRLLRFVRLFAQVIKPRLAAIDSIDLRYTNGFAVRWRDGYGPASV